MRKKSGWYISTIECSNSFDNLANSFRELYWLFGDILLPEKYLDENEKKDPASVYDKINDYKEAVEAGTKVVGIKIEVCDD